MNAKPPFRHACAPQPRRLAAALALAACLAAAGARAATYYVNDGSLTNDVYCSAVGTDANNGLSPATPVASLATILGRYTLTNGADVVLVDAGTYTSSSNVVIGAQHYGTWESRLVIQGAGRATVLSRGSQGEGDCCLVNYANYIVISNLTFTGAQVGLAIDASSCSYADISANAFYGNSGSGLSINPSSDTHYGEFKICHNLITGSGDGMVLEPLVGMSGDQFHLLNNTVAVTNGSGVIMGGQVSYSSLHNNIIVSKSGTCLIFNTVYQMASSDENDLWAPDNGKIAEVTYSGTTHVFESLAGWQRFTHAEFYGARDAHSFSRDPYFASPAAGDYHLRSLGGRWLPDAANPTGGTWVADEVLHSPCIDAASFEYFGELLPLEPAPNGERLNLGCYGGTAEASKSAPGRRLVVTAPDEGQVPEQFQLIYWVASGESWQVDDQVNVEYSLDGGTVWDSLTNGSPVYASSAMFEWLRPLATFGSPSGCWIRVTSLADAAVSDKAFLPNMYAPPPPSVFFVNDSSLAGDLWCVTAGSDTNDGLTPETPVATLQAILDRYTLSASNTVYVDAGTYNLTSDIVADARHAGDWSSPIIIQGAGRDATVLRRQSHAAGAACLRVKANHVRIQGFSFNDASTGLLLDTSFCTDARVSANTFSGNSGYALLAEPSTNTIYGAITIRNNLFFGNGNGMSLNADTTMMSASFIVVNNTVVNTNGAGVVLGGYYMGSLVRNNIFVADGAGAVCLVSPSSFNRFASDHNDFWAPNGGAVARVNSSTGAAQTLVSVAEWQRYAKKQFGASRDAHSFSRDPLFVSPGNQDYHASSLGGSWHDGAWTADAAQSPCVDAGDPYSEGDSLPFEPAPNGGRINLGAFGGTDQASRAESGRRLLALVPDEGQETGQTQPIYWNATGSGWGTADMLALEYSLDGGSSWESIGSCTRTSTLGYYDWSRPQSSFNSPSGCWVRVSCVDDFSVRSEAFLENTYEPPPTVFYVNDYDRAGDLWCTASGDYMNDGLSSNTPLDSIQTVISRYSPTIGCTIYVDAGTYNIYGDLTLPNTGPGGGPSNLWLNLIGAERRAVIAHVYGTPGSACLRVQQDFAHIEGFTFRGAETGALIDPSTCRNATLARNTFTSNSGFGIRVLPDTTDQGFDTYVFRNNLLYNNGSGMNLQAAAGYHRATFTVENNTVVAYANLGIACAGLNQGTTLKNNIVTAKGAAGFCLSLERPASILSSDYNNLHAFNGACVARWLTNNTYRTAATLADWQSYTPYDDNSLALEPLFVAPTTGDYHLRSAGGSWRNGAWIADSTTSPCVDAGDPSSAFSSEPAPNGGRVNMGAFGNTREASKSSPKRILSLLAPRAGEVWSGNVLISWSSSGAGWLVGDSVRLEYATTAGGTFWTSISGATSLSRNGSFNWSVPNPNSPTASYYLRVVCNQDTSVFDATDGAGIVQRIPAVYYVNDSATNGDLYCTAPGAGNNAGTSRSSPLNSLAEVFKRNVLKSGDTVYVDAGTYVLSSNIVIDAGHAGSPDAPIRVIGARSASVFVRTTGGTGSKCCLELHADHIRVEGLACRSADIGISVNASSARHVQLVGNLCYSNNAWGIEVRPYGGPFSGEEFQILQNVVYNNGAGLFLQCATNAYDGRGLFVVENNTVCNPGTGVKLYNANSVGKRTNLFKNNIIEASGSQALCLLALPNSLHYSDFNNLLPRTGAAVGGWQTGTATVTPLTSLSQWRAVSGVDKNSLSAESSFMNAAAGNYRLKPSSPCVDAGVISFWMFGAADADGKTRLAGKTADIGAYELFLYSSVRLFLQGPFIANSDSMTTPLSATGALPYTSPYADDPRTVTRIPTNVTDWVLLQFRAATNAPAFVSRSVFLRNDGWLVNDAGSPSLSVDLPPGSNGYLVVKHRNHLAAMTALPVAVTNQSLTYDFTASPAAFFGGTNGCAEVPGAGGPRWALRAGDVDGDGAVLPVDYAIQSSLSNSVGYLRSDTDLDGALTPADDDRIFANFQCRSPVPRPETVMQPILLITPARKTLVSGEFTFLSGPTADAASGQGSIAASSPLTWDFVHHASDASLVSSGDYTATYTAGPVTGVTDVVEAWDSAEGLGRAYLGVIGAQAAATAGKALVIAGRTSAGDTLWPTTDYLADSAYTTLRARGFTKENIYYLSPEPAQDVDSNGLYDDIDGSSTLSQAAYAFTNVTAGTDRLFVYLVDHGGNSSGNGYFRLSGSETLTAEQLDDWLDALQNAHNTHVTVLLDFCYAGSFLHALTYNGAAPRIVIAACDSNQPSYFVAGGLVSFSGAFFSGVMLGYDVMQCFSMAQSAMSAYQSAQLDDDKSGAYTTNDFAQATGSYIGPTTASDGDGPQIGEVCGNQVLTEDTSATLWIGSVSSLHPITRAWCLIVPPGHNPDPDNPVTDLPELELAYDSDSGRYSVTYDSFTASGTYSVSFYVQDDAGNVSAPRSSYIAQVGYDDRVILVAGGNTNSAAWPAIDYLTGLTYDTLRLRLFTPDHIRVLSANPAQDFDGDGTNDVAGAATLAGLQAALGEWALTNSTDRLTLYLLGEGATNMLHLGGGECLATNQLAAWVHSYQASNPIPVTVVLDFSGAGAFLPALADPDLAESEPDATRIAIASARAGREALFSNGGVVSFTQYLLCGVISGETLGEAYNDARRAIRRVSGDVRQSPQIDDNLNGVASEKDVDGLLADETYLGSAFVTGADAPVIGHVVEQQVLGAPGDPVTLWASEVAGMYPITNVWCVITPPGLAEGDDLPVVQLAWSDANSRYQATSTDFTQPGYYGLTFIAEDTHGELSDPVQSSVLLADAYEPDDARGEASTYDGSAQIHTFHASGDEDWVRVYLVTNFTYDIETYHLSDDLDTVIDLYRELEDGTLEQVDHVDEEGSDEGEYTGLDFPDNGWYWARLAPYSATTNNIGAYQFIVDIPSAAGLNTLVVLGVDDVYASALPSNSTVSVEGQGTKTFNGSTTAVYSGLTNGTYFINVPVPANFIAREAPSSPYQVQSLTNQSYANPRRVPVSGGWRMAGFEMLSTVAVTSGVVRDAWTRAYLGSAQLIFTASSGSLTGTVATGGVILTAYSTNWSSLASGQFPAGIGLGACNWHLAVALSGYQTASQSNAVTNVTAGAKLNLGTVYLTPTDADSDQLADAWETFYFGGHIPPNSDPDGDGATNLAEYLSGTDPTSPASVLRITDAQLSPTNAALTWSVAAGRSYEVLSTTSLVSLASVATNGPWEAAIGQTSMQWSGGHSPSNTARFYRIQLDTP